MGDFEDGSDLFDFTYSIDGSPFMPLFTSSVDELTDQTYTLEDGNSFTLDDPLLLNDVLLSNEFQTIFAYLNGDTGNQLTIQFTAQTDGGSEAFAFDNLQVLSTPEPTSVALWSLLGLVGSACAWLRTRR